MITITIAGGFRAGSITTTTAAGDTQTATDVRIDHEITVTLAGWLFTGDQDTPDSVPDQPAGPAVCDICRRTRPAHDHAESIVAPEHRHEWATGDEERSAPIASQNLHDIIGRLHRLSDENS